MPPQMQRAALLLLASLASASALTGNCSLEPYELRVDGLPGARYTGSAAPLLSWRLRLAPGAAPSLPALQGAYRLLAGASAAAVAAGGLYDSGWVPSNATLGLPYAGPAWPPRGTRFSGA
jgi:hypothetical protein